MSVFEYYDVETDATVYYVLPSLEPSPSSFQTDTESVASGTTIHSDDLPGYFVLHHGRQYPVSDNAIKWFPSDNIRRHLLQYIISRSLLGDYTGAVEETLAPIEGRKRQALELGTKTGTWVQAMADQFPHVRFSSLDIVPVIPHAQRHNITFEVYDITEGLMVDSGSQDAVFINFVWEMVKDYQYLIREAYRVLRPRGLLHIRDIGRQSRGPDHVSTPPASQTHPSTISFLNLVDQRLSSVGVDPEASDKLPEWLAPGSIVWKQGQTGFKDIQLVTRAFPLYPHDGSPCMDLIDARIAPYLNKEV